MKLVITNSEGAIIKVLKVSWLYPEFGIFNINLSFKRIIAKYFLFKKKSLKAIFFFVRIR